MKARPSSVTACLVTRGDVDMRPILDSLIFPHVIVWDNSKREDMKTAGRYFAAREAATPLVYFQDDDVLVPPETQWDLVHAWEPGMMVANYGHGRTPAGYDDLPLVCGGAIVERDLPWDAARRYLDHHPMDDDFLYDCDFAIGVLYPLFKHVHLPFEINMPVAQAPNRLVNQPFQREMKARVTERARAIRDMAEAA